MDPALSTAADQCVFFSQSVQAFSFSWSTMTRRRQSRKQKKTNTPAAPPVKPVTIEALPNEMMWHVASFVNPLTAATLRQVNKRWRSVIDSNVFLNVRVPASGSNRSGGGPIGVRQLTITSTRTPRVKARADTIQAVRAIGAGATNNTILRTVLYQPGSVRRVDLIDFSRVVRWMPSALRLQTHLVELHIVPCTTSWVRISSDDVRPIVASVCRQLRALSVPSVHALGNNDLPLLETLTVCDQPRDSTRPSERVHWYDHVRHLPAATEPGSVPLRIVTEYDDARSRVPQYEILTRYAYPGYRVVTAPQLTTLTISYVAFSTFNNGRHRFTLPPELPYDQVKTLTLRNPELRTWADLFVLMLPRVVRLSVQNATVTSDRYDDAVKASYLAPPVLRGDWTPISIWCVAPHLQRLSITQTHWQNTVSFPLYHAALVLHDAYPALVQLDLVDCVCEQYLTADYLLDDGVRIRYDRLQTLKLVCWEQYGRRLDFDDLSLDQTPNLLDGNHRTVFRYRSERRMRQIAVSYRLVVMCVDQHTPPTVVTPCSRCVDAPPQDFDFDIKFVT